MRAARVAIAVIVILAIAACIAYLAVVRQPAIAAVQPPARSAFASSEIQQGARLAAMGDCTVCRTTAGGRDFAGGLPVPTPFGVIYSTNITPDPETGIGRWSEAAFRRATGARIRDLPLRADRVKAALGA